MPTGNQIDMSSLPKSGAVLFAKDLPRLASFYERVAGLSVTVAETDVIVLESPTMQLVLHGIPARIARAITITSPPTLRSDTAIKLVFAITSLAQARDDAVRFGGALNA